MASYAWYVAWWWLAAAEPALRWRSLNWPFQWCCTTCRTPFCSPSTGKCYDQKDRDYYMECRPDCCASCGGKPFCSPNSGNCYDEKAKDYYLDCAAQPTNPTYNFYGVGRCDSLTTQMAEYNTATAAGCRMKCTNTVGCKVFDWMSPASACGGNGLCQLHNDWCDFRGDPCFEQYRLD
mmetsp:Transcript_93876/g.223294  ORF Transcript_93876/g.223294 Transcript_93876/m.223294 type:complete len:178 (+) Transcript_93876:59-592(+)